MASLIYIVIIGANVYLGTNSVSLAVAAMMIATPSSKQLFND